ncbi:TraR/DksA C4-type zinc finger protein [Candidatus Daviesbacteria bacterium]|nr:TraR/DksA C4-type zinc finger protein [Candidatus Daviesbacteria bacterium]
MLDLPQKTLQTIRKYLLRQKSEVEKNLKEVVEDDPATTPALAESSEPGTDSWVADAHNRALVFRDQLKKRGDSIKKALGKIRKGTYGKCERCGQRIELSRLLAMPTAQYCLSCSKKFSK